MATGTDFLLESLLKLAGVDVEKAKQQILDLGRKFHDQDALLHSIGRNQVTIIANQRAIMKALNISEGDDDGTARQLGSGNAGNGYDAGSEPDTARAISG